MEVISLLWIVVNKIIYADPQLPQIAEFAAEYFSAENPPEKLRHAESAAKIY